MLSENRLKTVSSIITLFNMKAILFVKFVLAELLTSPDP